jgi:hypothetical protein
MNTIRRGPGPARQSPGQACPSGRLPATKRRARRDACEPVGQPAAGLERSSRQPGHPPDVVEVWLARMLDWAKRAAIIRLKAMAGGLLVMSAVITVMTGLSGSVNAQAPNAQAPLHDPNLPSVSPEALQTLKDTRTRQDIMRDSLAGYPDRCVCQYQTQDLAGRSCKGRHEIIKVAPLPICYPGQVTSKMLSDWRRRHP